MEISYFYFVKLFSSDIKNEKIKEFSKGQGTVDTFERALGPHKGPEALGPRNNLSGTVI
jgi:hypothetical protein